MRGLGDLAYDLVQHAANQKQSKCRYAHSLTPANNHFRLYDVKFRDAGSLIGSMAGPFPNTIVELGQALQYALSTEKGSGAKAGKKAYRAISSNIPFLNLFYIKTIFDYMIGFQLMETMNPGGLKRVEKRMKKEYNQEYLFTKPSIKNKGF